MQGSRREFSACLADTGHRAHNLLSLQACCGQSVRRPFQDWFVLNPIWTLCQGICHRLLSLNSTSEQAQSRCHGLSLSMRIEHFKIVSVARSMHVGNRVQYNHQHPQLYDLNCLWQMVPALFTTFYTCKQNSRP